MQIRIFFPPLFFLVGVSVLRVLMLLPTHHHQQPQQQSLEKKNEENKSAERLRGWLWGRGGHRLSAAKQKEHIYRMFLFPFAGITSPSTHQPNPPPERSVNCNYSEISFWHLLGFLFFQWGLGDDCCICVCMCAYVSVRGRFLCLWVVAAWST